MPPSTYYAVLLARGCTGCVFHPAPRLRTARNHQTMAPGKPCTAAFRNLSTPDVVSIPVIAHGGAGCLEDIGKVVKQAGASAVALGSMVVFQKKGMGVLVNFPEQASLEELLT